MNENLKILNFILYEALVQIREEAHENNLKKSFTLSKWLHNLPLNLVSDSSQTGIERTLNELINTAEHEGFYSWLQEVSTRHQLIEEYLARNKGNETDSNLMV